ncbi:TPA: DUF1738 domain-containing protein [Candidatus Poribacteria bacterium]|nr:DUF1738 domain-containing protein [Candidatus Poribacteria bacterium]HIA67685.1 DUF1738 domain-containing protein [Candidatus Poribacteria bacterium]HIB91865.1 DUF1738 domain-containing protein [Candidatus Poribacteria bacterium]HIN30375.1 DUF1738 domain-containing protein [Candidatus Poribacteria bacterium]HIO07576.1 DUF1738 domain-containing protein [Candidatus Poribacteria bacterium]
MKTHAENTRSTMLLWYLPLLVLWTSSNSGNWRRLRCGPNSTLTATSPYPSGIWGTYKQWKDLGYSVRRGRSPLV